MEPLTITREKVLEAASKCSTAKATLEVLFPECFENEKGMIKYKHVTMGESGDQPGLRYKGKQLLNMSCDQSGDIYLGAAFNWVIDGSYLRATIK